MSDRPTEHLPQHANLTGMLRRVIEGGSAFYQLRVIEAGGIRPDTLSVLPRTQRSDLVRDQLDHLPHGSRRIHGAPPPVRAGISGSGDGLLILTWTKTDLAAELVAGVRTLKAAGVQPGYRIANNLPGALATPGSLLLGDVVDALGGLDVPLGSTESGAAARQAWELIDRVEPQVLVLDPATAESFFSATPDAARSWWQGIIWLQRDAILPPYRIAVSRGFSGWQRSWLGIPEVRSFVGSTCELGALHLDEDVIGEVVGPENAPTLPHGTEGALLLTTLTGDTPSLRYDTGLQAAKLLEACPCGLPGEALRLLAAER